MPRKGEQATVASVGLAAVVAASADNRTQTGAPCSSVREAESWLADPVLVALKAAGDSVAGGATSGEQLFRWPGQQQQRKRRGRTGQSVEGRSERWFPTQNSKP